MRITNDDYTPIQLVSELSARETCRWNKDGDFFVGERKKHPWLIEAWAEKLEEILELFKRYGTLVAETQSVRDQGIDIYLEFDKGNTTHRIGFQIKSEAEVLSDKRSKEKHGMVGVLKKQAFDAMRSRKVDEWWIVPCFNYSKHSKLYQQILSDVAVGNFDYDGMKVKIMHPREAVSFLSKDTDDIKALCTLFLCEDDEILKCALDEIKDLTTFQRRCILTFTCKALEGDINIRSDEIGYLETGDENDIETEYFELTDGIGFLEQEDGEGYIVRPHSLPGVCALYFEGRVRHGMSPIGAEAFVVSLLAEPEEMP